MNDKSAASTAALHECDETAWLEQTADLVSQGRWHEIDRQHLSEFLTDMAIRDKREVLSRLIVLLAHRLKWDFQMENRSKSWLRTMLIQSGELEQLLESNVLRQHAEGIYQKAYTRAVLRAAVETGLDKAAFPLAPPWSLAAVLEIPEPQ